MEAKEIGMDGIHWQCFHVRRYMQAAGGAGRSWEELEAKMKA